MSLTGSVIPHLHRINRAGLKFLGPTLTFSDLRGFRRFSLYTDNFFFIASLEFHFCTFSISSLFSCFWAMTRNEIPRQLYDDPLAIAVPSMRFVNPSQFIAQTQKKNVVQEECWQNSRDMVVYPAIGYKPKNNERIHGPSKWKVVKQPWGSGSWNKFQFFERAISSADVHLRFG